MPKYFLNSNFWAIFDPIEHTERDRPVSTFLYRPDCGKCGEITAPIAESAEIASYIFTIYFET